MNSKHLVTGDSCPPLVDGKLRIYSMRFCPYAQRALLVAAAKKIPYDVVNINLATKPEFIFEKNPWGRVPTLELSNSQGCLYESLIVSDYMDDIYPHVASSGDGSYVERLHSGNPLQRAKDRILIERFNEVTTLDSKVWMLAPESKDTDIKSLHQVFVDSLKPFDNELGIRGTKFFGGNEKPGMVDYMIWPWFERFPSQELLWGSHVDLKDARRSMKLLNAWEEDMMKDPAVQESYVSPDIHHTYRLGKKRGSQNYDLLLDSK